MAEREGQKPQSKGRFAALTALIGAASVAVLVPTVQSWEGREHKPYRDIVGIWTVCDGDTKNVVPGEVQTDEECDLRLERQLIAHARPVLQCVPQLKDRPNALAASASLAYNIGTGNPRTLRGGFCGSLAARRFRAGDVRGGCNAFLNWNKAGGRVVRGLTRRRSAERAICLRDASQA